MTAIKVTALQDGLPFGARITGVTRETLADEAVRQQINDVFEERGMIVFEDVEPSGEMQVLISEVFGPLKDHPVKTVERVDQDKMPGVITIRTGPDAGIVEIDGKQLMTWQPWHFDHSYNNELNRAGVLRAETIAAEGGLTGFADGIQIYNDMAPEIRAQDRGQGAALHPRSALQPSNGSACRRASARSSQGRRAGRLRQDAAQAVHPAVWTRKTGEKVLHMSPYGWRGIEGMEMREGDALLAGGVGRDRAGDQALLPPVEAHRHAGVGQLAHAAHGLRLRAQIRSRHAPHDDQGRLRPGPLGDRAGEVPGKR